MAETNPGNIIFYSKSYVDIDKPNVNLSATDTVASNDGSDSLLFLRNRNNNSGWGTSNSDDTANTELLAEFGDLLDITDVMLIKHTFKDFIIEYKDPADDLFKTWENFTNITEDSTISEKATAVVTRAIKITIFATQVANSDKLMRQLIITKKFLNGRLESWPIIKKPTNSKNRRINKMLSSKVNVVESRGSFNCELDVKLREDNDLDIVEAIYENREGVLLLLSGNKEAQFASKRQNYRNEDIVLVRPTNEYVNPYLQGVYSNRLRLKMKLNEAVF